MNWAKICVLPLFFSMSLGWLVVGCGGTNTDVVPCKPAAAECLSSQVGQICDGQGRWAAFLCAADQACVAGACVAALDASTESCKLGDVKCVQKDVGQVCQGDRWVAFLCGAGQECRDGHCVSACTSNERKCLTSTVLQVCPADGTNPVTAECPAGSGCVSGECVGSCTPNARDCSASHVVRECRANGSGYVELPCTDGQFCQDGRCVGDPNIECYSGEAVCKDLSTALTCKKDGSGYDSKPCAKGTSCSAGRCRGPVCAAGASECLSSDISKNPGTITCDDDGAGYTVKFCQGTEVCLHDYFAVYGECYSPICALGEAMCGDPDNPGAMPHRLSRCETLSDSRHGWVAYECDAPAVCKEIDGRARCVHPCVPGEQRCGEDTHAIDNCDQDGNWVAVSCNPDGGDLVCVQVPLNGKVACGDPMCRELQGDFTTYKIYGVCVDLKIQRCGEDGKLRPPVACDYGECVYDGFRRYMCQGAK